jgi:hypothetical protein
MRRYEVQWSSQDEMQKFVRFQDSWPSHLRPVNGSSKSFDKLTGPNRMKLVANRMLSNYLATKTRSAVVAPTVQHLVALRIVVCIQTKRKADCKIRSYRNFVTLTVMKARGKKAVSFYDSDVLRPICVTDKFLLE